MQRDSSMGRKSCKKKIIYAEKPRLILSNYYVIYPRYHAEFCLSDNQFKYLEATSLVLNY